MVIWSVAPESMIEELTKVIPETFNPTDDVYSPDYTNEQDAAGL